MLIRLILVQIDSVFGSLDESEAVRGVGLVTVIQIWRAVSDWPGCWGKVMFMVRVGFRALRWFGFGGLIVISLYVGGE